VRHHELAIETYLRNQETTMPKFVIERDIPGAGKLSPAELKSVSLKEFRRARKFARRTSPHLPR